MPNIISTIKPYFRWLVLGGTLFFLLKTFKDRVAEISTITIDSKGWLIVFLGLIVTIVAHVWSGWVWTWILDSFKLSLGVWQGIKVYLITNIAKYLPGNVWHFYGRVNTVSRQHRDWICRLTVGIPRGQGNSWSTATFSVLLEPLLMAAAALLIAIISTSFGWIKTEINFLVFFGQIASLFVVLIGIQPRILNPIIRRLSKSKKLQNTDNITATLLQSYPLIPFLGEIGFVLLRGSGFLLTFMALQPLNFSQIIPLLSAFSIAWLLGLVIPGAPGGIGVFEATAIALLDRTLFPPATVLVAVAIYRVISILAEAIAAGVAVIIDLLLQKKVV
ncbi:MAG TPA: UPF0104 family protein [Xenococcaceae cyanobacterium]